MTIGSFSTTNANSTIASLGSQRSDWGDGFDRPMTTLLDRADADEDLGRAHVARRLRLRGCRAGTSSATGYPAGRFQFNGAYTRANNSAALNDRAQSWAQFLLGLPTAGDRRGRDARHARRASSRSRRPASSRRRTTACSCRTTGASSRRLTLNLGAALRDQQRHERSGRTATSPASTRRAPSPIEAAAQAAYALESDPADSGRASSRSRAACCSPTAR